MTYSQINHPEGWGFLRRTSAGHVSQESVKKYILEQQGKDVFEYNVFNDPTGQSKIGDFSG